MVLGEGFIKGLPHGDSPVTKDAGEPVPVGFLFSLDSFIFFFFIFEATLLFDLGVTEVIDGVSSVLPFLQEKIEDLTDIIRVDVGSKVVSLFKLIFKRWEIKNIFCNVLLFRLRNDLTILGSLLFLLTGSSKLGSHLGFLGGLTFSFDFLLLGSPLGAELIEGVDQKLNVFHLIDIE